jgi:hypothetical protein
VSQAMSGTSLWLEISALCCTLGLPLAARSTSLVSARHPRRRQGRNWEQVPTAEKAVGPRPPDEGRAAGGWLCGPSGRITPWPALL